MKRRITALVVPVAMCLALAACGAGLDVPYSSVPAIAAAVAHPGANPPGANDWTCRPTAAHPQPVVLVHGTLANMTVNFDSISPLLKNNGYCVYAFNYGGLVAGQIGGTGLIPDSAAELSAFVDRVLASTGAAKVDIVGHSQGGMMPRYYLKYGGGAAKVRTLVGLAPSNHGTTLLGLARLASYFPWSVGVAVAVACASCLQQIDISPFMKDLNAGGDTVPGVQYTVIESRYDEVVTPYTSAFLTGPNVTNITLQDHCLLDASDHLSIAFDHIALQYMLNALDPAHPAEPACTAVAPVIGG